MLDWLKWASFSSLLINNTMEKSSPRLHITEVPRDSLYYFTGLTQTLLAHLWYLLEGGQAKRKALLLQSVASVTSWLLRNFFSVGIPMGESGKRFPIASVLFVW